MRQKLLVPIVATAALSLVVSLGATTAIAGPGDMDPGTSKSRAIKAADDAERRVPAPTGGENRTPGVSVALPTDTTSPVTIAAGDVKVPMTLPGIGARRATTSSDGVVVRSGTKTDLVLRKSQGRVQALTVLSDSAAATTYQYCFPGSNLSELPGGQVALFRVTKTSASTLAVPLQAVIGKAWATDATGRQLSTGYAVSGDCLVQTIDTRGAAFPVVADPSVSFVKWWPPTWEVTLNPKDQRIILSTGGAAVGAAIGAAVCSSGTPVAMVVCAAVGAAVVTAVTEAFKEYGVKEGCNWKARVQITPIRVTKKWRSGKC